MALEDWRTLVDLPRLAQWMTAQGIDGDEVQDVVPLTGGTQNILLRFRFGNRHYVLRRPPGHSVANGSETMRREARILGALAGTDVPHPALLAACADEDVLGAAFYLMEPIDGFNATEALPPFHRADPGVRHRMGLSLVDGIVALGRVNAVEVGLADLGNSDNFLARQPARWRGQLESYAKYEGWPGARSIPGVAEIGAWLEANCPDTFRPGIMHGDYHLANVMYRPDSSDLAAIIDWELATLGDPLIDLGWLLATWPGADTQQRPVNPWDGFPGADELIEHYRAGTDRDISALSWYKVLACYKLGILLEGTYARAAAGKANPETGQMLHEQAIFLFRRALRWMGQA